MKRGVIKKVLISGYKSIWGFEAPLELNQLNVLIGANGSGKSNFMTFFEMLNHILTGSLELYVANADGAKRLLHRSSRKSDEIRCELHFNVYGTQTEKIGYDGYGISFKRNMADKLIITSEKHFHFNEPKEVTDDEWTVTLYANRESALSAPAIENPTLKVIKSVMSGWRFYQFHDTSKEANVFSRQFTDKSRNLYRDGGNLAPFLFNMREKYPSSYNNICYAIRQVAPFFREFILEPTGNNVLLEWIDYSGNEMIAAQLSDGTLRFMMLAALLMQPNLPNSIFIDEPELGLHPYAIDSIASLINDITKAKKAQITISTQSPSLIDYFAPEDVLVVEQKNGQSSFSRLSSGNLASWLDEFSLGEAWKSNAFGGNPNE